MISVGFLCVKMSFKTSFQGKKRSRHVYKMHRSAVEHEWRTAIHHAGVAEKKSFIFPMIYRRLLALHTTRRENVIARVRRTFWREFRMPPRPPCLSQNGIDHWLVMTFQINHLSTSDNYIGDKLRTGIPVRKKRARFLIKRCIERDAMATCWKLILGSMNSGVLVDQSRKIFMSHVRFVYTVCAKLSHFFTSGFWQVFTSRKKDREKKISIA